MWWRTTTSPTGTMASMSRPTGRRTARPTTFRTAFPLAIDFYSNDIFNMGDNCFETDGGARNIRVFRNRCFNSAAGALSVQPIFGGPVYFYQNLVYNAPDGIAEIHRGIRGNPDLQQHHHRRRPRGSRLEPDFPQQPDPGAGRLRSRVRHHDVHELFEFGLQRVPAQPGRRRFVRMELAAFRSGGRFQQDTGYPTV